MPEPFDPTNPEELREALSSGALIPPKTPEQLEALARLETTIALIEGWVDAVTEAATARLPKREAIAESVRRRRATGGPAEKAFGTLVAKGTTTAHPEFRHTVHVEAAGLDPGRVPGADARPFAVAGRSRRRAAVRVDAGAGRRRRRERASD